MKKSLKRLLQCSIVLLLLNCQSEDLALDSHEHKHLQITEKSFEALMADAQFRTAFGRIQKSKATMSNSLQARTAMEAQYGFTIADTPAKVIETDNKISYTLLISREEENNLYFENLIIQVDSTNQIKAAIVKYLSGQENQLPFENAESFEQVAEITPIVFDASLAGRGLLSCISITRSKCNGVPYDCGGSICGFATDTYCTGGGGPGTSAGTVSYISGPSGGGSSSGGGGNTALPIPVTNPTPEPEPDPNNPQNPADNFGNLLTTPVKPTPTEKFNNALTDEQEDWLDDHLDIKTKIETYLNQLGADATFAQDLVEYCIDNNLNDEDAKEYVVSNIIEEQIDDSNLDDCTKGVLNKLKTLQQNDIAKIISKLGNVDSPYKVKISSATNSELNWNELAVTNWQIENGSLIPYSYNIKIKTSFTSVATDLGIASTILHELVHAYFLSLIDDCHYENNCEQLQAFPEVWNYYVQHTSTNGISQHEQLAQSYAMILASALQEFHTGTPVANGQMPLQLYKDLAWGGLEGTIPYQALSNSDVYRINKTDNAENYNQPQYNITGTALEYFPQGTPCP